ncbi:MAG: hypothetical protein ACRDB0_01800 [Paraclostridium sp.]
MKKEIVTSGVLILLCVLIYQNVMFKSITERLDSNIDNMQNISMKVDGIKSDIVGTLESELGKTYLTKEVVFDIDGIKDNYFNLSVRAELSRISDDAKVIFMYKEEKDSKWDSILLESEGGLSYNGYVNLDFSNEKLYNYKIVTEGTLSESGEIHSLDKYDFVPQMYNLTYGEDMEVNNGSLMLGITLEHNFDDEGNMMEEIKGENGFIINDVEFMLGINGKKKTYKAEYKEATQESTVVGEIDMSSSYEAYVPKKDYKDKKDINIDYIKIKVTYENGFIDTRDITNEVDQMYID